MLTKIQIDLIETIKNKGLATSVYLSDCLLCSKRSIINYVKEINSEYPILIRSTKKGYYLDEELFEQICEEYSLSNPFSSEYRSREIVRSLFTSNNDTINLNDLSSSLFVSDSTIRSDLYDMKRKAKENISFAMNKADVKLLGKESMIRSFYFSAISGSGRNSFFEEDPYSDFFPGLNTQEIEDELHRQIDDLKISINEVMFSSLFLQILISLSRNVKGKTMEEDEITIPRFVRESDYAFAKKLASSFRRKYQVDLPRIEVSGIALLIASYNINCSPEEISLDSLHLYLWPSLNSLFNEICDTLKDRYRIDIRKKPSNAVGLAIHLRSLIHRSSVNMFVDNPISVSIKNMYPISFECAIYIARRIFDIYNIIITEDEITFLAIYVVNNMCVYHSVKGKISVLFVIPSYSIISGELYEYYRSLFETDIKAERMSQADPFDKDRYDLVVTTLNNSESFSPLPVITINPFINPEDELIIKEKINELKNKKRERYIHSSLDQFMDEKYDIEDHGTETLEDCLQAMIDNLYDNGIISENLKEDVIIRARLANTVTNSIALLRPCLSVSNANTLSICRLKEPVSFDGEKINMILLLTFNEPRFIDYLNVMEYLYFFLSDKNNAKRLLDTDSFEKRREILLKM